MDAPGWVCPGHHLERFNVTQASSVAFQDWWVGQGVI